MLHIETPNRIYGELFEAVQGGHVFEDSKTFADAVARSEPAGILEVFRSARDTPGFDLGEFIAANFDLPDQAPQSEVVNSRRPIREEIDVLWDILMRDADVRQKYSSLIPLPGPFIVPGGRFREVYYWDSYFTMLGLAASGRIALLESTIENFAYLIDQVGFIPNGNRTYYCTRSQPPLFVLMVELLAEVKKDPSLVGRYLGHLEKEYEFWMSGWETLRETADAVRRVVRVEGGLLNRYWDDTDTPRPESHFEDVQLSKNSGRDAPGLYRDLRAACESGWDFSSRWLGDDRTLASIRTTQVVPVDLNAILFRLESVLASECSRQGIHDRAKHYKECADRRRRLIQTRFFDGQSGMFVDLLLPDFRLSNVQSLAAAFPLFMQIATPAQARSVTDRLHEQFLKPGGWVTTLIHSGQQWDSPLGWAPSQWVTYVGMKNYGFSVQANEGAGRWIRNNLAVYRTSGRLLEKYNVEEIGGYSGGGEYGTQSGFGWTNGVLLRLMEELGAGPAEAGQA